MTITVTTLKRGPMAGNGFAINAISADASGCEVLKSGVTGKRIIVDQLLINTTSAITVTIGQGEDTSAVVSSILGPLAMPANGSVVLNDLNIGLDAEEALTVDSSGAGALAIFVKGRLV